MEIKGQLDYVPLRGSRSSDSDCQAWQQALYLLSRPTDPREGSLVLELSREGGSADR